MTHMGIMERFSMDDRVAIVTGGSKGLGKAMAEALAEAGANVIVASRTAQDVEQVAKELETAYG
jgi:7-alpha-hydroxysteroid dehydrogenase